MLGGYVSIFCGFKVLKTSINLDRISRTPFWRLVTLMSALPEQPGISSCKTGRYGN